jgi:hypothetical protein
MILGQDHFSLIPQKFFCQNRQVVNIVLFVLFVFALKPNYCIFTKKIDIVKEKEAIKVVIENETNSFLVRDFVQQSKSFLQDESLIMLGAGKLSYFFGVG